MKQYREFKQLIAKSNLGYNKDMTVDVSFYTDMVSLNFSSGFTTTANLLTEKEDHLGNLLLIYTYEGYNNETHYLHVRIVGGEGFYFQTVQTGLNAGGSTFNSNEYVSLKPARSFKYTGKINTTPDSIKKIIGGKEVSFEAVEGEIIEIN